MFRSTVVAVSTAFLLTGCGSPSVESPTPVAGPELAIANDHVVTVYKSPT